MSHILGRDRTRPEMLILIVAPRAPQAVVRDGAANHPWRMLPAFKGANSCAFRH
jgi:hypothetical protein